MRVGNIRQAAGYGLRDEDFQFAHMVGVAHGNDIVPTAAGGLTDGLQFNRRAKLSEAILRGSAVVEILGG